MRFALVRSAVALIALTTLLFSSKDAISGTQTRAAVAANFGAPMREISAAFEQRTGHKVSISSGSSGKLYAQVLNGAPFDVFLSADTAKPAALIADGQAVAESRFTYAIGTLVLWAPGHADPYQLLRSGQFRRLAIANPRLAPYGAAADEILIREKIEFTDAHTLITAENIAQAYQFVASGNVELGFVALSQLIDDGSSADYAWIAPPGMHAPIAQDAVLLLHGESNPAARELMTFLKSPTAQAIIRRFGYRTADR